MKNIRFYIGVVVLIVLITLSGLLSHFYTKYQEEKESRLRLQDNQRQMAHADSLKFVKLSVTLDEFNDIMTRKVDSIMKASKIKAKNVQTVTERFYYYRDTSYSHFTPEPVNTPTGKIYPFSDLKKCILIEGYMTMDSLRPSLVITNREVKNNSIDIGYLYRPHKFIFIKYGKWKADLVTSNDCGETTTKVIEIIKK